MGYVLGSVWASGACHLDASHNQLDGTSLTNVLSGYSGYKFNGPIFVDFSFNQVCLDHPSAHTTPSSPYPFPSVSSKTLADVTSTSKFSTTC